MSRRRRLFPWKRAARVGDQPDPRIFATRHRFLLILLVALIPVLAIVGLARGVPVLEIGAGSLVLLLAAVAGMAAGSQHVAAGEVVLGLGSAAAILVWHLDGYPESFYAFFLALVAVSLYQETRVLLVALIYVASLHAFSVFQLYRESGIFRAGVADMPFPVAGVALEVLLVLLLIAGWRVTGREHARRVAAEDMIRIGFERAAVGMATLSPSGEFIYANRALTETLGPVNGANVSSVIHSDDVERLGQLWEDMGRAETRTAETWLRLRSANGRAIWGKTSLTFVRASSTRPATILLQLEEDGARQREQALLEARLAGRDEFVAAIAADIREPVDRVLDLTTLATADPPDLDRLLHQIDDEARRVASIVDDLGVSARAGTVPFVARSVDAALMCREVMAEMLGAGDITIDVGGEKIWADPSLTIRILRNLVANAVRYGGRNVRLEVTGSGPDTVISVIDEGPGIAVEERERMFDADLQGEAHPTRPAAVGLSLTVSRRLARQMDGEITYRRTGDGRNVFELRLPAEPVHAELYPGVMLDPLGIPA